MSTSLKELDELDLRLMASLHQKSADELQREARREQQLADKARKELKRRLKMSKSGQGMGSSE